MSVTSNLAVARAGRQMSERPLVLLKNRALQMVFRFHERILEADRIRESMSRFFVIRLNLRHVGEERSNALPVHRHMLCVDGNATQERSRGVHANFMLCVSAGNQCMQIMDQEYPAPFRGSRLTFPAMWLFIACVSTYDAYLISKYAESIWYMESNPLGRLLLHWEAGDPSLFIAVKFLGTILTLGLLTTVRQHNPRLGELVAACIATFQMALLLYLAGW